MSGGGGWSLLPIYAIEVERSKKKWKCSNRRQCHAMHPNECNGRDRKSPTNQIEICETQMSLLCNEWKRMKFPNFDGIDKVCATFWLPYIMVTLIHKETETCYQVRFFCLFVVALLAVFFSHSDGIEGALRSKFRWKPNEKNAHTQQSISPIVNTRKWSEYKLCWCK